MSSLTHFALRNNVTVTTTLHHSAPRSSLHYVALEKQQILF